MAIRFAFLAVTGKERLRRAIVAVVAMLIGGLWCESSRAQTGSAQPPPSVRTELHRRHRFEIPVDTTGIAEGAADKEIRLYSSADRARTWQRAGTASTRARAFGVNVGGDGEYLFAVVLVPTSQRDAANAQYRPSYRAIVDTQSPKLELQARRTPTGAIVAQWRVTDRHLDRESFQLTAGSPGDMRPVAIDPPRGNSDPTTLAGSTTWWPEAGATTVSVRAQVSDRLGNPASMSAEVSIPADGGPPRSEHADAPPPERFGPPPSDAPPTIVADASRSTAREASLPRDPRNPGADENPLLPGNLAPPAALDPGRREPVGGPQAWDEATSGQTLPRRTEQGPTFRPGSPRLDRPSKATNEELPSPSKISPAVTGPRDGAELGRREPPAGTLVETIPPPSNHQNVSERREAREAVLPPAEQRDRSERAMPPGERARVLGSRRVSLEYDVASVGPSGIAEVELYATTDGGRTWQSLGIDADNRSPFVATLAGEGLYGFRLVVRNNNRIGGRAPTAGDLPEMWIVVDETKPVAAITAADIRAADGGRELVIHYEAADARLAARPISLYYAEKPTGPWQTIGVGLPNNGSHAWPLDRRLADRVYLRLEVHDEGGNVGAFETANAIVLDESEPVGRIRSVDTPRGASVQERWPRYR